MGLQSLRINRLRNLDAVEMEPGPRVNLIYGANASGKTSLLEAIYLLGKARSFRSAKLKSLVQQGSADLAIFARCGSAPEAVRRIGIRLGQGETEARIDGERAVRRSDLARILPVAILTPQSHGLLERGPELRRRFLDWAVFHVEPGYHALAVRYQRALRQRNAALRASERNFSCWDYELVQSAEGIDQYRRAFMQKFRIEFAEIAHRLLGDLGVGLDYRPGWSDTASLEKELKRQAAQDQKRGYTYSGPHRADLRVLVDGADAASRVSRGQQKLLAAALILAKQRLVSTVSPRVGVVLVDDFASELDQDNREGLLAVVEGLRAQVFVTSIARGELPPLMTGNPAMFHVEQGRVTAE